MEPCRMPPPPRPARDAGAAASPSASGGEYAAPRKRIATRAALAQWESSSPAHAELLGFVRALAEAVRGVTLREEVPVSPAVAAVTDVLATLEAWVEEIPPVQQAMRYGNTAYRTWHARLEAQAPELMRRVLPPALAAAEAELTPYFLDSFGNATRIDYGTGHETAFAQWLLCLCKLRVLGAADRAALVTRVYARYLALMRRLQTTYWLEPAGSHGVWGLDDYQFLCFIFGAAQLEGHPELRPGVIHDDAAVADAAPDFLYLAAVQFVRRVKRGPLRETSPMLSDVAAVPSWARVTAGMLRMYEAEVLGKLPIAQHFLFGTLLRFEPEEAAGPEAA